MHRMCGIGGRNRCGGHRGDRRGAAHRAGATRADDRISESGMEDRKRQGYF
ncbi:hypothetical protein I551_6447 [Mycobacterium ulcerans str. Harvey]|uniref:Uncharacterized protein n=1 Tax=Mycobacterium ulcerans str. Harvey TaxID=1299332 RepID=A0ABP3A8X7_MYCUL|nr:hypothetical protein I551_6447 [Mycobacterium ulcerans str. Harvey]